MRKFLMIIVSSILIFSTHINSALAFNSEYTNITNDTTIIDALEALKNINSQEIIETLKGKNISKQPIRIMFRKLEKMNPAYKNYEAFTCIDNNDKIYIFINSRHREAPVEALAALIAHETTHQDAENSIAEETEAWSKEAIKWLRFTKNNPSLANKQCSLVKRLNTLAYIYKNQGKQGIYKKVKSNSAYKNLDMASAGYEY